MDLVLDAGGKLIRGSSSGEEVSAYGWVLGGHDICSVDSTPGVGGQLICGLSAGV